MEEAGKTEIKNAPPKAKAVRAYGGNMFDKVFNLLIDYKDSRLFKWISTHPEVSLVIVGLWGMLIIVFFLWFVMRIVQ
jgi:hypothetical protein